ncbi:MAG: Ni/Fe hydrogenase [Halochromatium sp.]|nr:Ni/Fe hydrogenase [Halochromatium sp.]
MPVAPILVLGYGNPSRGDDALGPLLIDRLQQLQVVGRLAGVELLTDFQPQIEHLLDLLGRERVIFVDAAPGLSAPYRLLPVETTQSQTQPEPQPEPQSSSALQVQDEAQIQPELQVLGWTSHRLTPGALAHLFRSLYGEPPRLELLAIGAEAFELGAALSARAEQNLRVASNWLLKVL